MSLAGNPSIALPREPAAPIAGRGNKRTILRQSTAAERQTYQLLSRLHPQHVTDVWLPLPFCPHRPTKDVMDQHQTRPAYLDVQPLDLDTMRSTMPPDLDFVLPGLLPGTVGSLIAAGAAGKSWLALQVAVGVASGRPIAGGAIIPGRPGPVTILAGEDPPSIVHHRVFALEQHERVEGNLNDRVRVMPLLGAFPVLLDRVNNVDLQAYGFIRDQAIGRRLMLIDTLRRLHHADENDSGAMSLLVSLIERIAHQTQCAIVFLHHVNKSSLSGGSGDNQAAGRGSSALVDNIRWSLALQVMTETEAEAHMAMIGPDDRRRYVRMAAPKANYTSPEPDVWMRREGGGYLRRVENNGAKLNHDQKRNGKRGVSRC